MLAEKEKKQQSGTFVSASKYREKHPSDLQRSEQPLDSLQILQRSLGNHYLQALSLTARQSDGLLIQRACACGISCKSCMQKKDDQKMIQPKLKIGAPNDTYEQEADRIAEQVIRMPEPSVQRQVEPEEKEEEETFQTKPLAEQITPLVQRQAEPMEEEEEETLQTKTSSGQLPTVSSSLQNRITALGGGGQPLPQSERDFFEPRFGTDFSQVRVHADSQAAETASAVNARAFTLGHDIIFGAGLYQPSTFEGRHLLAHELTHTVQQSSKSKGVRSIQRAEVDDNPEFCFPREGRTLQDVSDNVNEWIAGARQTAEADALHIVNAVYQDLGSGGVRARIEERIAALPRTHVRHVQPSESRYRGQQWFPGIAAQLRTRRLSPVVNLCGVCVGADKLGHFFAQGYEYFRLGQQLRQRIRSWSSEDRERFLQRITPPLPAEMTELRETLTEGSPSEPPVLSFEFPSEFREDQIVEAYTNEFGKWLEGFEHHLPPEEVNWIRGLDFIPWWYNEGIYGRSFSGVLSRADLAANRKGGRFYIDLWRNPTHNPDICDYVDADWNEHHSLSLSTFVEQPIPTGPRSRSTIAEEI